MKVVSMVPASDMELALNQSFIFEAAGQQFEIQPLSLKQYYKIEKEISGSVLALEYYGLASKNWRYKNVIKNQAFSELAKYRTITKIMAGLMYKVSKLRKLGLIIRHNWRYKWYPREWIGSFSSWLEKSVSWAELMELVSYFLRYCVEIKKKIRQILQKGIDSLTQETRETSQPRSVLASMLDYLEPGSN